MILISFIGILRMPRPLMWVPINEASATHTDTSPKVAFTAASICLASGLASCLIFICVVAISAQHNRNSDRRKLTFLASHKT